VTQSANSLAAALDQRYRIAHELGAGGMATVYLAHDVKHDRDVAIKVLHPDLARSLAGERFLREISISARLNHPHILALLDSGSADDGELLYYVMPVATGESLRERLVARGALPVPEAIRLASDVAEALAYAHGEGVVHRDIKPENVLLSGGHAIVVDFGIAKAIGAARDAVALTGAGISLGTPAYMSPEQAAGEDVVDHRSDIYAIGAMLFEMVSGSPAFAGSWTQIAMEKLSKAAPSLASRSPATPPALVSVVDRCLARDAAERPQTAEALLDELRGIAASSSVDPARSARARRARWSAIAAGIGALAVVGTLGWLYARSQRHRWVRETAIPAIQHAMDTDNLDSAFALLSAVSARAPHDSLLDAMWYDVAIPQTFLSEPAGALVERAPINDTLHWVRIGTTPTPTVRIPKSAWFYRYTKPGYRPITIMGARLGGSYVPIPIPVALRHVGDGDTDMVLLRGGKLAGTFYGLPDTLKFDLSDFLMDRLETTNRQYKRFVDAGGYTNRKWWDSTIVRDGKPIPFATAMALFVDKTGRPGPSTWEGGAAPDGTDDLPVGGLSWYEARAYARFMGKALPTVIEWNAAAIPEAGRWVVPNGRYESSGPVRGGAARAAGPRGVYDLAGNVREWTINEREPGQRFILGGGWSDPSYLYSEVISQPELDRSAINGVRLVRRLGEGKDLARASAPIRRTSRNYDGAKPVDDATYRGFLAMYDYDHTPLTSRIVSRDTTPPDWIREDVEFDMPRGSNERMAAVMFLPKHAKAPYQTIVIFPATDAQILKDPRRLSMSYVDFIVRNGRAAIYPIYDHTYGRDASPPDDPPPNSIAHRDQMLRWAKEMRRSIDYASTRADVDTTRFGYNGVSWGARLGGTLLAVEPRIRAAVLDVAGLGSYEYRPEEDPVNFLPHIRIPVLVLSGRYDSTFPYVESQKPFMRLLGSAVKKQIMFDGGHFLPRPMMMEETLKWFDEYLGPVQR